MRSKVLSPASSRSFGDAPQLARDDESKIPEKEESVKRIPSREYLLRYFLAGSSKTRGLR
jgi:hypothetical protein